MTRSIDGHSSSQPRRSAQGLAAPLVSSSRVSAAGERLVVAVGREFDSERRAKLTHDLGRSSTTGTTVPCSA